MSLWLSMVHRAAAYGSAAAIATLRQAQRSAIREMTKPPPKTGTGRKRKRR